MIFIAFLLLAACNPDPDLDPPAPSDLDSLGSGWRKIPCFEGKTCRDIFFINSLTGYAVADNEIYKSTDGGNTWELKYKTAPTSLINIGMDNDSCAIFISERGDNVHATIDGGKTFQSNFFDVPIVDVFFVGHQKAYMAGAKVWKTIDGGGHWDVRDSVGHVSGKLNFFFTSESRGWMISGTDLRRTLDSGRTWNKINTDSVFTFDSRRTPGLFFVDSLVGYAADLFTIGKSVDGGLTWNKIYSATATAFHDLHFVDRNLGYMLNGVGISKTENGGSTWTKEVSLSGNNFLYEIHFTDKNHGWAACGSRGFILKYEK